MAVTLNLSDLHPSARNGALECGALAETAEWVGAHRREILDYASVQHWVLSTAHYYGSVGQVPFPITARGYSGALTFKTTLSPVALTDPSTRAPWAPSPTVLVACWLMVEGRPATWDRRAVPQVISTGNIAALGANPLVLAVAYGIGGTPVTVSGSLTGAGRFFVPRPVTLVANLRLSGAGPADMRARPGPLLSAATIARVNAQRKALAARLPQLITQLNRRPRAAPTPRG